MFENSLLHKSLRHSSEWNSVDYKSLFASALIGLVLAVIPHFASYARYGTFEYLVDNDDVAYLAVARAPYYGDYKLRDPYSGHWEQVPAPYAWMQFVPLAKLAASLGVPLILSSLMWRVIGGIILGCSLFLLFRRVLACTSRPTAWALGCAIICLADAGFIQGHLLLRNFTFVPHMLNGTTPLPMANAIPQYRIVTPLLNLPFVLLLAASLTLIGRTSFKWVVIGAASLAMCLLLYFYFWTAAAVALGMYLIWLLVSANDPSNRARNLTHARYVAIALVGGAILGAPQVINNWLISADPHYKPILARMLVHPLAPDDPKRYMYLVNYWVWLKLMIGAIGIFYFRLPGLRLLWCFTLAGYVMANSAIVTGTEFQNFHWSYVHAAMGEVLVLSTLSQVLDRLLGNRRMWLLAIWALPVCLLLIALVWRPYEALYAPETVNLSRILGELRPLKPALASLDTESALAGPFEVNVALLHSRSAQLYNVPYSWTISMVPDTTLHQRHALNGWLQGMDLPTYIKTAATDYDEYTTRPEWQANAVSQVRGEIFQKLLDNRQTELQTSYRPNYLILPTSDVAPERGGPWRVVQRSASWTLWARRPPDAANLHR